MARLLGIEPDGPHEATISGYPLDRLGGVPEAGETVVVDGVDHELLGVGATRLETLRARPRGRDG